MRALVLVFLVGCLVGCLERTAAPPFDPPLHSGPDPGSRLCRSDSGCRPGEVCARTGQCMSADLVHFAHVMWTVSGMAASPATCAAAPDLRIHLNNADFIGGLAYAPLPCEEGKFSIDKLPLDYVHVWLGRESGDRLEEGTIDTRTGEVTLDLPYGSPGVPGVP
ncbi:MAG TPA: hypothetical protein VF469_35270 [Kofleriaceae bacterium]